MAEAFVSPHKSVSEHKGPWPCVGSDTTQPFLHTDHNLSNHTLSKETVHENHLKSFRRLNVAFGRILRQLLRKPYDDDGYFSISRSPGKIEENTGSQIYASYLGNILLYDRAPACLHDCCHPDKGYRETACTAGSNVRSAGET